MNELKIFNNSEFGDIRTIEKEGKPYFVGRDVARALGYAKPENAIAQHCRGTLKQGIGVQTGLKADGSPAMQNVTMNIIPESDLYRLIINSQLPSAEKFEQWVFDEVLPSIRKHGAYMTPETIEKVLLNPDTIIDLATRLKQEQQAKQELEQTIAEQKPKVLFADAVTTAKTSILVGELAKILKQNGIETGQNRLFEWLRKNGFLIRRNGTDYNMPTQHSMELGLFEIKETSIVHADGHTSISKTPKVTTKGQAYFINIFFDKGRRTHF